MGKYLVGIDEGTTGCKTCVFDLDGHVLGSAYREYKLIHPQKNHAEQDPFEIKNMLFESCAAAIKNSGVNAADILAVALSTQAAVTGLLDENEEVIGNFLGWQDLRGWIPEVTEYLENHISDDDIYENTGHPANYTSVTRRYIWLKQNEPEKWKKAKRICTQQDYFLKQFGAQEYVTDISSAGRYLLANIKSRDWFDDMLNLLDIRRAQLPRIATRPGEVVGKITEEVSAVTGLPVGCPLCVGGHDQNCNTIGSGSVGLNTAVMTLGTLGTCAISVTEAPSEPLNGIVMNGNVCGGISVEATVSACASSFRWFKEILCDLETISAKNCGLNPYDILTHNAQTSPLAANGVLFIPFLNGSKAKRYEKGSFIGMSLSTTKSDLNRAVIEGIGYMMNQVLLDQFSGISAIENIYLTGGLSKSEFACQMYADIFNKTILIPESSESACLGAALLAGTGIGVYKNIQDAVKRTVRYKKTYHPRKEQHEKYAEVYNSWCQARKALIDLY